MSSQYDQETADKFAVAEALYDYIAGIDLRDAELMASVLTDSAASDFRPAAAKAGFEYPVLEGRDTIVHALMTSLSRVDTTHSVNNPRVTLEGDKAVLDALVEAQHVLKTDHSRSYLMKNRYDVKLVRQGETWRIQHIVVDNVWRTGDPAVLAGI
jgi:septum formation inhibitor-activating ATPase MinD